MKNKLLLLIIITFVLFSTCGCSTHKKVDLKVEQLKEISEWITLEAEYHNVGKGVKSPGKGITHLGEKERKYWVEYTGVIKIGVKAEDINMIVKDEKVKIKMPEPSILFINYKDYDEDSIFVEKDSWFNSNDITYEEINSAMIEGDKKMIETATKNKSLFVEAKKNLEASMTNYIEEIGKLNGTNYEIEFSYK